MTLLGLLLVILSIIKLYLVKSFNGVELNVLSSISPIDVETLHKYIVGIVLADGLIGLICGLFIVFV